MQPAHHLLVVTLPILVNTQAFGGSPAGGASEGRTSTFPDCAKDCITIPQGNFDYQIQDFCSTLPSKGNCIINACSQTDKQLTYQSAQKICAYLSVTVSAPTYRPTAHVAPDVAPSISTSSTKTSSRTSSSSRPLSTQTHSTTTHKSTSTLSTLRTSTHSSTHSSSPTSSTLSTLRTSTHSSSHGLSSISSTLSSLRTSTHSSTHSSSHTSSNLSSLRTSTRSSAHSVSLTSSNHASSTTTNPSAPKATLSVYNGYVGAYCYTDASSEAGVSGHTLDGNMLSSSNMTIQTCLDHCETSGWGYAGLENGSNCYCGYGIVNGGSRTSDSTCNMGCSGDGTQNCGGPKALSVYESG